ncbi:MAG: hypothetical protein KKD38_01970 [Candidatus Delongbacteria bacterium]|nr:hypothetical protein [Candidatus Delongbacteria bacterium]
MNFQLLKKDFILLLRNRTAITTFSMIVLLEIILVAYSRNIYFSRTDAGIGTQFNFLQNHILIFFFPVIIVNIISIAFSLSAEKQNVLIAKLIPFGESMFLRSKVIVSGIISSLLSFPYIFSAIYFGKLDTFQNANFLFFSSFFLLFVTFGIASISTFYAVKFYDGYNNFEPDLKGILGLMFFISLTVVFSFSVLMKNIGIYYDYTVGFRKDFPNKEFIATLFIGFLFLIITRILLNVAEKKLIKE